MWHSKNKLNRWEHFQVNWNSFDIWLLCLYSLFPHQQSKCSMLYVVNLVIRSFSFLTNNFDWGMQAHTQKKLSAFSFCHFYFYSCAFQQKRPLEQFCQTIWIEVILHFCIYDGFGLVKNSVWVIAYKKQNRQMHDRNVRIPHNRCWS